jgi:hypothetical protein
MYETMRGMLDIDHKHPLGLMQVAQVWDSEEYAQRFDEELLAPILRAVGAPLDAEVAIFELEDLVTP